MFDSLSSLVYFTFCFTFFFFYPIDDRYDGTFVDVIKLSRPTFILTQRKYGLYPIFFLELFYRIQFSNKKTLLNSSRPAHFRKLY